MDSDSYQICFDYLINEVKTFGYVTPKLGTNIDEFRKTNPHLRLSGIDLSKRTPVSLFYLPAINASNPDAGFFRSYYTDVRDIKRHILRVQNIVDNYYDHLPTKLDEPVYQEPIELEVKPANIAQELVNTKITEAEDEYLSTPIDLGLRNSAGYRLTVKLLYWLKDEDLVESKLESLFSNGKMQYRIPGYIESAKKFLARNRYE